MIKALVAMVGAAARTLGKATLVMQDSKNLPSAVPRRIAFVVWSDLFLRIHHTPALRTQQPWMQACAGAAKRRCQEALPRGAAKRLVRAVVADLLSQPTAVTWRFLSLASGFGFLNDGCR